MKQNQVNANFKLWRVIDDGQKYIMIPDHYDTDHKVVATGLSRNDAARMCDAHMTGVAVKNVGNFFTGLMHISSQAVGHCVKTVKDGYDKGRN